MTAAAEQALAAARQAARNAAGEFEKLASSNRADNTEIAASLRRIADISPGAQADSFARNLAQVTRRLGEWRDRRYGAPSALQKPDRDRDRVDAIIGELAATYDLVAAASAPAELAAATDATAFGDAHQPGGAVTVIIPVVAGFPKPIASIAAASRARNRTAPRILVVSDGSADASIVARLRVEAAAGHLELIEDAAARGFSAAVNLGLRAAKGDAVVLDCSTLVSDAWLDRLAEAAGSANDLAAVVPMSNAASAGAYPVEGADNLLPSGMSIAGLAAATGANEAVTIPIPAAGGGCMYLTARGLAAIGLLDANAFPNAIEAITDWALCAVAKGLRSVAAPRVFVFHDTAGSLAPAELARTARATKTLNGRHPQYPGLVDLFRRSDPLATARRSIDGQRLRASLEALDRVVVHLVHGWGGGVEVHAIDLATRQIEAGAGALVLKIAGNSTVRVILPDEYPNLSFDLSRPVAVAAFREFIAPPKAVLHLHHVVGLDAAYVETLMASFIDCVLTLHDFYFVTPQITLRDWTGQPCPVRPSDECDHCVSALTPPAPFVRPVAAHRTAMAKIAGAARRVFTPSTAARDLLRRGMPDVAVTVAPHIDQGPIAPSRPPAKGARIVATIGAFNADKGARILADVIKDAGERALPLRFVIAGQAVWKQPPPNVSVLGPYDRDSIAGILERVGGQIAFLPSIVPETYMFSLSECVRAGYFPVVFDLGAQAERVRKLGWGAVLPLGTSPSEIADMLRNVEIPPIGRDQIEAWLTVDRLQPLGYYSLWPQLGRGTEVP